MTQKRVIAVLSDDEDTPARHPRPPKRVKMKHHLSSDNNKNNLLKFEERRLYSIHPRQDTKELIIANFKNRCDKCNSFYELKKMEKFLSEDNRLPARALHPDRLCWGCQRMLQYLDLGFHTEDFRQSYLLPISEAFSFHEFIPILNTAIDARLEAEIDAGTNLGDAASRPLVVDFEVPLQAAGRRK